MSEKEFITKLAYIQKILDKDPDKVQALATKGMYLGKLKRYSEAIVTYNRVLELEPDKYDIYAQRAFIYSLLAEGDKAMRDIDFLTNNMDKITDDFTKLFVEKTLESIQYYKKTTEKLQSCKNNTKGLGSLLTRTNNFSMSNAANKQNEIVNDNQMALILKKIEDMEKQNKEIIERAIQQNNELQKSEMEKMKKEIQAQNAKSIHLETSYKILNQKVSDLEAFTKKFPEEFTRYIEQEKKAEDFFKSLNEEKKKKIKDYVKGFKEECSVIYTSSLVIKSGNVEMDVGNDWVDLGTTIIGFIPFIGDFLSQGLSWAYEKGQKAILEAKAANLITCYQTVTEFEQSMNYIVLSVIMDNKKQDDIENFAEKEIQEWWGFFVKIHDKIQGFFQDCKDLLIVNVYEKTITDQHKLGIMDSDNIFKKFLSEEKGLLKDLLSSNKKEAEHKMIRFLKKELQEIPKDDKKTVDTKKVDEKVEGKVEGKVDTTKVNKTRVDETRDDDISDSKRKPNKGSCNCCIIF